MDDEGVVGRVVELHLHLPVGDVGPQLDQLGGHSCGELGERCLIRLGGARCQGQRENSQANA